MAKDHEQHLGKSSSEKPYRPFTYPCGEPMCQQGQVRAARWGSQHLNGELNDNKLEEMARWGEGAIKHNANVPKRNLIAMMVHRHVKSGDLDDFVDKDGNFISNSGARRNIHDEKFNKLNEQLDEYEEPH